MQSCVLTHHRHRKRTRNSPLFKHEQDISGHAWEVCGIPRFWEMTFMYMKQIHLLCQNFYNMEYHTFWFASFSFDDLRPQIQRVHVKKRRLLMGSGHSLRNYRSSWLRSFLVILQCGFAVRFRFQLKHLFMVTIDILIIFFQISGRKYASFIYGSVL